MLKPATAKIAFIIIILMGSYTTAQVSHDDMLSEFQDYLRISQNDIQIASDLESMQINNGYWPDLNYTAVTGKWQPREHLNRLYNFSMAYTDPLSIYYKDQKIHQAIVNGLQFFYDKNPHNMNWWIRQILVPRSLCRILIFMRAGDQHIPTQLEDQILARLEDIKPKPSNFTGANKIDISIWRVYVGLLKDNAEAVETAVNDVYSTFKITTSEGIQPDYSFYQHGPMFLPMNYGKDLVDALNNVAVPLISSPYEFAGHPNFENYSHFLLGSLTTVRRGQYVSFSSVGRKIISPNSVKKDGKIYTDAIKINPTHTSIYEEIRDRAEGVTSPTTESNPYSTYYHRALFTSHSRPDYKFTVLANNYRVKKTEMGNGENIQGQFLSEGATNILVNGNEYFEIFPVWEWNKIPGTTTPEYDVPKLEPRKNWGYNGTSTFSGAVSDGTYGAQVFDMNDFGTQAKKTWFMFDEEIVALGTGISSTESERISTTVNQSLLDGEVHVAEINSSFLLAKGDYTYEDGVKWILHDSVGYFFPNQEKIRLTTLKQTGARSKIKRGASSDLLSKEVFKLWFDHGITPEDDTYSYILTPGKVTVTEMESYDMNRIKILENSKDIQAVKHHDLDMIQVIFHKAKNVDLDGIKLGVSKPSALILKNLSTSNVELFISDPAEKNSEIEITLESNKITPTRKIKAAMPLSEAEKGSTVKFTINENTPKSK